MAPFTGLEQTPSHPQPSYIYLCHVWTRLHGWNNLLLLLGPRVHLLLQTTEAKTKLNTISSPPPLSPPPPFPSLFFSLSQWSGTVGVLTSKLQREFYQLNKRPQNERQFSSFFLVWKRNETNAEWRRHKCVYGLLIVSEGEAVWAWPVVNYHIKLPHV